MMNLLKVSPRFTVAAAFGNVHGVYKPGNVKLQPVILHNSQEYLLRNITLAAEKPINFVFHGGSGSSQEEIREAILRCYKNEYRYRYAMGLLGRY
jgi:fructose-bisphosphate aldolase class II